MVFQWGSQKKVFYTNHYSNLMFHYLHKKCINYLKCCNLGLIYSVLQYGKLNIIFTIGLSTWRANRKLLFESNYGFSSFFPQNKIRLISSIWELGIVIVIWCMHCKELSEIFFLLLSGYTPFKGFWSLLKFTRTDQKREVRVWSHFAHKWDNFCHESALFVYGDCAKGYQKLQFPVCVYEMIKCWEKIRAKYFLDN